MVRRLATSIVVVLAMVTTPRAEAHPLHTSYMEITRDRSSGTVSISVRLFADDFGSAMKELGGAGNETIARAYFERSVSLTTRDGNPVALEWCGMRTADGLTWLCARSRGRVPEGRLRVRNTLMFGRFSDQVSIVRLATAGGSRTIVLTSRAPEGQLTE
jgi:hypothetical protein